MKGMIIPVRMVSHERNDNSGISEGGASITDDLANSSYGMIRYTSRSSLLSN